MLTSEPLFGAFHHRTRIEGKIRCMTALRVGAGKTFDAVTTDLPVLRGGASGLPLIPGASIKGVVRSQVEAVLRAVGMNACDPVVKPCLGKKDDDPSKNQGTAQERAANRRAEISAQACEACKIFGGMGLASHVVFADAPPADGTEPVVEVRDGVAIDRDLMRAADKRKYDYEVVAAGSAFAFSLTMHELGEAAEGAVLLGVHMLEEGFARLGGFKSRGLGQVRLEGMKVWQMKFTPGESLTSKDQGEWAAYRDKRIAAFHAACQQGGS